MKAQLRWRRIPTRSGHDVGALIAFYQVGYGVAAFGDDPLRQLAGLDYSSLFCRQLVTLALAIAAVQLIRHPTHAMKMISIAAPAGARSVAAG